MTDLIKAIRLQHPETIPVQVSILPAAWLKYGGELQKLTDCYPQFFGGEKKDIDRLREGLSDQYRKGSCTDEWGCVWSGLVEGMQALVTGHPIKNPEDIFSLQIPGNRDGRLPHGFMYLRLLDLCGFENAMLLFAEEGPELTTLIDKVLEYNIYQIASVLPHAGEVMYFGDDLGMQDGLAIGPAKWRKYLGPCFRKMYGMIKAYDPQKLIYMHTDGCIYEIMPDLVKCGVDMINPQIGANGLDNLVRVCRSEQMIPICLDLDRQVFPFATASQLESHVGDCVEALWRPEGGLALNIEFNFDVPLDSMAAVLDAAEKYRHYKG